MVQHARAMPQVDPAANLTVDQALRQAVDAHRTGRLEEAEGFYRVRSCGHSSDFRMHGAITIFAGPAGALDRRFTRSLFYQTV